MSDAAVPWFSPDEWQAIRLSLKVAVWACLCSIPVAVFAAYALARWRFWGHSALNVFVHLPLVLPPVVTGYLLLLGFGRTGFIGAPLYEWFGITVAFRWSGAALAAAVMAFPLMVRVLRLSFEAVDPKLEHAAQTLGAPRFWVFVTITLPLVAPGILSALVLGFAKAIGEFGATITFVSNIPGRTQTLPSAIYSALQIPGGESGAARLALISITISIGALALTEWLARHLARRIKGIEE